MTEKDTSETTAGNQDKIQLLSNLRYIPQKKLIPIPYKNAGKHAPVPEPAESFPRPDFQEGVIKPFAWNSVKVFI